jgi:hypothetical protein
LDEYVCREKKLAFIEALCPSLAHNQGLKYATAEAEFSEIHWRKEWTGGEINDVGLFHPVKSMAMQNGFRL